jgi:transposase
MKKRSSFTPEFKQQAVQRALNEDRSIAEIARELGIKPHRLYQWRSEYLSVAKPESVPAAGSADQEIARLRRELERVRQERDFLKKAAAFFARNPE